MSKEREGWAEEVVDKLRSSIAAREYPGFMEASIETADKGTVRLLFLPEDVKSRTDTELAEQIRYRVAESA